MKNRIQKLIDVKSIITMVFTGVFAYLSLESRISADQFLMLFTTIIAFYFGTQYEKSSKKDEK